MEDAADNNRNWLWSSVQSLSHVQLCDPMDCSMPGFPVHHQLLEPTQTHVHQVGDAIQPSHPLLVPSPPIFSLSASGSFQMSQFFASGGQSIGASALASVLPMNMQDWSPLGWTGWISLQSKGLSRVFSNTTVQKHHLRTWWDTNLWGDPGFQLVTGELHLTPRWVKLLSRVRLSVTTWTVAYQAPPGNFP